ncbi:MAG: glycoside hydrolase family 9 protein [Uliginosibacterium sp.]|nr:glycoside hydrolase family 9 protein [Uliginosibacterium sp.]
MARVLDYPTTAATFSFAAVAAQCARIWKTLNPTLAAECSEAAKRAWDAALLHPDVYRYGEYSDGQKTILRAINEGGGAYADTSVSDARMWAAMELYLSESTAGTPDSVAATEYLKRFHETYPAVGPYSLAFVDYKYAQAFTWKHMKNMGLFSLLANGRNAEIVDKLKKATNSPNLNTAKPTVFWTKWRQHM